MFQARFYLSGQHVNLCNSVNLISEKFYPDSGVCIHCRENFQYVSPNPESTAFKIHVVAVILDIDQLAHDFISVFLHTRTQGDYHFFVVHRVAQTVDTGYAGDNDYILSLCQSHCRRKTQLVNLVIDSRVFCNISVRRGDVGFRLVVVVVGDKVFYRIIRKKFFKFSI